MLKREIDEMFTKAVAYYIAEGWLVHTDTMRGTEGEIAKVDMVKDGFLIRVLLDTSWSSTDGEKVQLIVGSPKGWKEGQKVWNNKLMRLSTKTFFKVSQNYYTENREELSVIWQLQSARFDNRRSSIVRKELGGKAKEVALRYMRRRVKGIKPEQIDSVYKISSNGINNYYIEAKGRNYALR